MDGEECNIFSKVKMNYRRLAELDERKLYTIYHNIYGIQNLLTYISRREKSDKEAKNLPSR